MIAKSDLRGLILALQMLAQMGYPQLAEDAWWDVINILESHMIILPSDLPEQTVEDMRAVTRMVDEFKLHIPIPAQLSHHADTIMFAARTFNIDPRLIVAIIMVESGGRENALGKKDGEVWGVGLMQVVSNEKIPNRPCREDLLNPTINIIYGTYLLRKMLDAFPDDPARGVSAYFYGIGNMRKAETVPTLYLDRIRLNWQKFQLGDLPEWLEQKENPTAS